MMERETHVPKELAETVIKFFLAIQFTASLAILFIVKGEGINTNLAGRAKEIARLNIRQYISKFSNTYKTINDWRRLIMSWGEKLADLFVMITRENNYYRANDEVIDIQHNRRASDNGNGIL